MGIFNTKIFSELEEGLKNFSDRVKNNFNENESSVQKCPSCGAQLKSGVSKCEYCGSNVNVKSSIGQKNSNHENAQTYNYPVLVAIDDETNKFYAYDIQSDYGTDTYSSVAAALEDMQNELQEIVNDGEYGFEMWTEEKLMQKKYAQKEINNGAKIKFVELQYVDPKNDPDW